MYARRIDLYGDDMTRVGEQEDIYRCAYIYSFARNRERNKHVLQYIFIYAYISLYIDAQTFETTNVKQSPDGQGHPFFFSFVCLCVWGGAGRYIYVYIA